MSQPAVLAVAPSTATVYEIEDMRPVLLVQLLHFIETGFHHLVVPRHIFVGTRCGIAYQGVVKVLRTAFKPLALAGAVDVGEIVHLQLLQQFLGFGFILQDGGHDDHCGIFLGYQSILELNLECVLGFVDTVEQLVEQVDHHLAHRHPHQQGEHSRPEGETMAPGRPAGKQQAQRQCQQHHNPYIKMCTHIPLLRREELPTHMLAFFVGFGHQRLHKVELLHPAFLAQAHYLGAVIVLCAVVHLVVHVGLFFLQHLLRETHTVQQLFDGQLGHLLDRVEDVHHQQVLA